MLSKLKIRTGMLIVLATLAAALLLSITGWNSARSSDPQIQSLNRVAVELNDMLLRFKL